MSIYTSIQSLVNGVQFVNPKVGGVNHGNISFVPAGQDIDHIGYLFDILIQDGQTWTSVVRVYDTGVVVLKDLPELGIYKAIPTPGNIVSSGFASLESELAYYIKNR